jgi:hypothetical protein
MKEHSLFMQLSFTPRDKEYTDRANKLRMEFDRFLNDVVNISNKNISSRVIESGEIVTQYTKKAEEVTIFYTDVNIPTEITEKELKLTSGDNYRDNPKLELEVSKLNERAINLITAIIDFKTDVLGNVTSCKMFTLNYPLLIDHILREARLYLSFVKRLQSRDNIDIEKDIIGQELFWNRIMAEHSKFIRGLLDPTEEELFEIANAFGKEFDALNKAVIEAVERCMPIDEITAEIIVATKNIKEFNTQGTIGLLECKIKSIIIPLLGDHVLRETNHYLRILKMFNKAE